MSLRYAIKNDVRLIAWPPLFNEHTRVHERPHYRIRRIKNNALGKLLALAVSISCVGFSARAMSVNYQNQEEPKILEQRRLMLDDNVSFKMELQDLSRRQLIAIQALGKRMIFELTQTLKINNIEQVWVNNGAIAFSSSGKIFYCNGFQFVQVPSNGQVIRVNLTRGQLFIIYGTPHGYALEVYNASGKLLHRNDKIPFAPRDLILPDNKNSGKLLLSRKSSHENSTLGQNAQNLGQNEQESSVSSAGSARSLNGEIFEFTIISPNGVVEKIEYNSPFTDWLLFPISFDGDSVTFKGYRKDDLVDLEHLISVNLKNGNASSVNPTTKSNPILQFYKEDGKTVVQAGSPAYPAPAIDGLNGLFNTPSSFEIEEPLQRAWAPNSNSAEIDKSDGFYCIGIDQEGRVAVYYFKKRKEEELREQHFKNEFTKKLNEVLWEVTEHLVQKRREMGVTPDSKDFDKFTEEDLEYIRDTMQQAFPYLRIYMDSNNHGGLEVDIRTSNGKSVGSVIFPAPNRFHLNQGS